MKPNSKEALEQLELQAAEITHPLGYEIVALESSTAPGQGRILTLFIDFVGNTSDETAKRIGIEDCMKVNEAVDQLFESTELLSGQFTLDVSSPGVERPLRKANDFAKFSGQKVRIHTFRSLEESETGNPEYWAKNKKQKNFVGRLEGMNGDGDKVMVNVDGKTVTVPVALISKAHLEYTETVK